MKKNSFHSRALYAVAIVVAFSALFLTGCKPEPDNEKTETEWLIGSWANAASGASFTITKDMKFEADIYPEPGKKARVSGRLDNSNKKLGPNEFILMDMVVAEPGKPNASYTGNEVMPKEMVAGFNGTLVVSLNPNANKTEFKFTSNSPAADLFFGGDYTKKELTELSWLVGTWFNDDSGASFTIHNDMKFDADIYPVANEKARVRGFLDKSNPKLEEYQYIIKDLKAAGPGDPDTTYTGNSILTQAQLNGFNGTLIPALTPMNDSNTKFRFTSNSPAADVFFGGIYDKQ